MKVLIIEDEPFAQQELKRLLDNLEEPFEILEMIDSIEDAVEWMGANDSPDLIFLDIQLADGLSFEIFKQIEINSPVIFTTAFDQYAIDAFKLNSIDYLLKPIKQNKLDLAIKKLIKLKMQFGENNTEASLSQSQLDGIMSLLKKTYKSRFIAKVGGQIKHIPVEDIAYFYAEDNVVFVVNHKSERYIVEYSIEEITQMLDPKLFFRLNRAFVAHIKAIDKVHKYLNSRLKIDLKPVCEKEVLISRVRVGAFMQWMDD